MLIRIRQAVVFAVIALALTFAYTFLATGVDQVLFKHQADGSITSNGSTLIGQNWSDTVCPGHPLGSCVFQGRPDDLGPYAANPKDDVSGGDNPLVANGVSGESGPTNLGPRSKVLLANTEELVAYWHQRGVNPTPDLVTTSGSGYDPDISQADALAEVPMVSKATGLAPATLRALIASENHSAALGFLGSSYIDVLQLNVALEKIR